MSDLEIILAAVGLAAVLGFVKGFLVAAARDLWPKREWLWRLLQNWPLHRYPSDPSGAVTLADLEVGVLALDPGDALVVYSTHSLRREFYERIKHELEKTFPGHTVIVMDRGLELEIITPQPSTPEEEGTPTDGGTSHGTNTAGRRD